MRKLLLSLVLAGCVAPSMVMAQPSDMSTILCEEIMASNTEDAVDVLIWLDGWLAGQANNTMLDGSQLENQVAGIMSVCQQTPSMSLMNAAKQYVGG